MKNWFSRQKTDIKNEQGQSVILVSLMIVSFLMFFSFTLNTGLLINAKISVQTAADAAAYAGAATQARQLNAISYLNYDMRRQFKKFLFRYAYVGSMGSPRFPANSSGSTTGTYDFPKNTYEGSGPSAVTIGLKAPVLCLPMTSGGRANDNCLQINVRNTANDIQNAIGWVSSLNPITQTYIDAVKNIGDTQDLLCKGQGDINMFMLFSWLFRANIDNSSVVNYIQNLNLSGPDQTQVLNTVKPLITGLGLYPRNAINSMRIDTLKSFINQKAMTVTQEDVIAMERAKGADAHERTILAFKSALANLNGSIFDADKVTLQELQPDTMLNLSEVNADFNVYVQAMKPTPTTNNPNTKCASSVFAFRAASAPIGVKLIPIAGKNITYAVKLKAYVKPRGLLFAPGSAALELDAVAGAKPFGSRIGPSQLSSADVTKDMKPLPLVNGEPMCKDSVCPSPLMDIGANSNFYSIDFLTELKARSGGNNPSIPGILNAQRHAMAPNPEEIGVYNVLPPPASAAGMKYEFIPYSDSVSAKNSDQQIYRFYAPLFPEGEADTTEKVKKILDLVFPSTQVGTNDFGLDLISIRNQVQQTLVTYINGPIQSGSSSEYQESETFAAIELPMANLTKSNTKPFWLTEGNEVLTSWGPDNQRTISGQAQFVPRFNYSVKFVAMRDLLRQGVSAEDSDMETMSH